MNVQRLIGRGQTLRRKSAGLLVEALEPRDLFRGERGGAVGPTLLPFGVTHFEESAALLGDLEALAMLDRPRRRRVWVDLLAESEDRGSGVSHANSGGTLTLRLASDGDQRQEADGELKTAHGAGTTAQLPVYRSWLETIRRRKRPSKGSTRGPLYALGRGRITVAARSFSSWRRAMLAHVPLLSSLR